MKILYICYEDISGFNGATRHIAEVVKGFSNRNNAVSLCVPFFWKKRSKIDTGTHTKLRYIPTIPLIGLRPLSYVLLSIIYMPFLYFCFRPDAVYIREIKFTILPVLLTRLIKIPCVLEVNGLIDEREKLKGGPKLLIYLLKMFHSWNLKHTDHIITVTSGIKEQLLTIYGLRENKITII